MNNTIRVSYRLPIEIAELLEQEAVRSRRTKTAVLIMAIEDYVLNCDEDDIPPLNKAVDSKKKR